MAIKINELMIGDWVYIHEPECKGHHIDYINEMDKEVGADGELYSVDDIRPIPLTKEILEKNGWKIYANGEHIEYYCSSEIPNLEYNHILKGYHYRYAGTKTNICIYYVHQLQRLLNLCNIDKEIIL